jgi:hypothetical protein
MGSRRMRLWMKVRDARADHHCGHIQPRPVAPIGHMNCRKIALVFLIIKGNDMRTGCLQCRNCGNTGPAKA